MITWEELNVVNTNVGISMLGCLISQLTEVGDYINCERYLKKYSLKSEKGTIGYLGYLDALAYSHWCKEDYDKTLSEVQEYLELSKKLDSKVGFHSIEHTNALALRDSGKYKEALEWFIKYNSSDDGSAEGNKAKCYLGLKMYDEAEDLLAKSLELILENSDYNSCTNLGYAYLWLAELMHSQEKFKETAGFIVLCRYTWDKYAPGLLYRLNRSEQKMLKIKSYSVDIVEAKEYEKEFLKKHNISLDKIKDIG